MRTTLAASIFGLLALCLTSPATAQPAGKPPPYSIPWKLRGAIPATAIVSDTQLARYEDAQGNGGLATVETVLASYKIIPELSAMARLGFVQNTAPAAPNAAFTNSGAAFLNPVIGGLYGLKLDDFRLGLFLGVALPLGSGGGDAPDPFARIARTQVYARAAMDNAMFAVNDLVVFPGVGFAYVKSGLTLQAEVTLLELLRMRARDDTKPGYQEETDKTNLTSGLLVGYFVIPALSFGAELHYQRWLNAPAALTKALDTPCPPAGSCRALELTRSARDQASFTVGPRLHLELGDGVWIRPGIAYERGIDWPMSAASSNYHNVQVQIPVTF